MIPYYLDIVNWHFR